MPVALVDVGELPAPTITSQSGAQWVIRVALRGGNRPGSTVRTVDEPAPTLVMGSRVNDVRWVVGEEDVEQALEDYRGRRT